MKKTSKRPPTRTMKQGLRPYPPGFKDTFSPETVREMEGWLNRTLADSQSLSAAEVWLLDHVLLLAELRGIPLLSSERSLLFDRVKAHEDKGRPYSLTTQKFEGLNRVVLQIDQQGRLDALVERVKEAQMRRGKE